MSWWSLKNIQKGEIEEVVFEYIKDLFSHGHKNHERQWWDGPILRSYVKGYVNDIVQVYMKDRVESSVSEIVNTEEFLDSIVDRLKRKQL